MCVRVRVGWLVVGLFDGFNPYLIVRKIVNKYKHASTSVCGDVCECVFVSVCACWLVGWLVGWCDGFNPYLIVRKIVNK